MKSQKIFCVGPQWRGSNAGGLFRALSRTGHVVSVLDENYYINLSNKSTRVKALDRLFRHWHIQEFNRAILEQVTLFKPDVVLIYKGAFVLPATLHQLKAVPYQLINFYPDVSFRTHGSLLQETLPLYDQVFTTKTFGLKDMKEQLGITASDFIPHGFDPDIHRPIAIEEFSVEHFKCDVSFIGGWSDKKERVLYAIRKALPDISIKVWGSRWQNCKVEELQSCIQGREIAGDLYALGILSSKINLGLLHERVEGASSGDKITSRTFHIPGTGGFMLHERTEEIGQYFEEDKEAVLFSDQEELIQKIKFYLEHEADRKAIAKQGHQRALKEHSLDHRARLLVSKVQKL